MCEAMNPAPPVTRIFMPHPSPRSGSRQLAAEIFYRPPQPLLYCHDWPPAAENPARERDVRLADLRIIDGERLVRNAAARACQLDDELRELQHGHLVRVADVHRRRMVAAQETENAFDEVGHIAEAARLAAVAEHCQVLAAQRLRDEVRHDTPILLAHAWPKSIKNTNDPRLHAVRPLIRHRDRLGEALRLVVHAARADRVDVPPVVFLLRMDERIAVDLGRRRPEKPRALLLREAERLVRAERADLERLDRVLEIVDRARGRREMQDRVERARDVDEVRDVLLDEREALVAEKRRDVVRRPRQEVVDADDVVTLREQAFAEVGADETGAAGDEDPRHSGDLERRAADRVVREPVLA